MKYKWLAALVFALWLVAVIALRENNTAISVLVLGFLATLVALIAYLLFRLWRMLRRKISQKCDKSPAQQSTVLPVAIEELPNHPVGQIIEIDDQALAIVDLGVDLSRQLRVDMQNNILRRGEPFSSGGVLGISCLPILGVGSTAASSLLAGNVFLATANPATLMSIGSGVGSAVMGSGGIIAQAPFIAAGSAIIPVVAPVMFFMTVSAMMMSARFDQIQACLNNLSNAVEQLLVREIADDYGALRSAMERVCDIAQEFEESRRFTDEMKFRMALVERDVNTLHHKYDMLSRQSVRSVLDADMSTADINLFLYSSLEDIQIDRLRLKLTLQDNPDDVFRSLSALNRKIDRYEEQFRWIRDYHPVDRFEEELSRSLDGMSWWKRNVFSRGKKKKMEDELAKIRKLDIAEVSDITARLGDMRLNLDDWSHDGGFGVDRGHEHSVVYYREEGGRGELRAFYTEDLKLIENGS